MQILFLYISWYKKQYEEFNLNKKVNIFLLFLLVLVLVLVFNSSCDSLKL